MVNELIGKVAIVTGGASGIGAGIAERFVAEGAKVVIADVEHDRGEALAAKLGADAVFRSVDVSDPEQIGALVAGAVETFGGLDVMVNNAGVSSRMHRSFLDDDLADFHRVMSVNVLGVMAGTRDAARRMATTGGGSIINVSSIEGLRGAVMVHPYVASKWAVRGLTKSAALELAPQNIRVNSIHPGFIRTPMTKHFPDDMVTVPLGRPGTSEEVASFVVFLASDESSYATGAEFVMDGGLINDVPHKF